MEVNYLPKQTYVYLEPPYEVRVMGEQSIVHDQSVDRYVLADTSSLPARIRENLQPYRSHVGSWTAWAVPGALLLLVTANVLAAMWETTGPSSPFAMLVFVPYILLSIVIHEGAHIAALRAFGRRHDKVGFRFHYVILPAFYVRMSQSHLLDRYERLVVHAAGILTNLTINIFAYAINEFWLRSANLAMAMQFATVALVANALPFLSSDGYRVILALADIPERRRFLENPRWIRIIKVASGALVVVYGWSVTYSIVVEWIAT